jgi:hypothetical protein
MMYVIILSAMCFNDFERITMRINFLLLLKYITFSRLPADKYSKSLGEGLYFNETVRAGQLV